jgi:hypothetical protein
VSALRKLAAMIAASIAVSAGLIADARMVKAAGETFSNEAAVWREIQWPFLMDEWGKGRAFVCKAADCGSEVLLYLRVKVGFCSCSAGVTDDDDLDRLGDLPLLSNKFVGLTTGHSVKVDDMIGRSRPYQVSLPLWQSRTVVAIALHAKCDAVVATVVTDRDRLGAAEQQALAFLGVDKVMQWTQAELGS